MKVFTVVGVSNSGKTTVVEGLIQELLRRGRTVGSVKVVNCGRRCHRMQHGQCKCGANHRFTIDTSGEKNSGRHRLAGSRQVTTWAENETAVMFQRELSLKELASLYDCDYMIIEGDYLSDLPRIVTASTEESARERLNELTFAVCGRVRDNTQEIKGLPVYNPLTEMAALADLVEKKVYTMLPQLDSLNCGLCGSSCKEMAVSLLKGAADLGMCRVLSQRAVLRSAQGSVALSEAQEKKLLQAINRVLEEENLLPSYREIEINMTGGFKA